MNPAAALRSEHSRRQTESIAAWVGTDAARFAEIVALTGGKDSLISQRASWVLSVCLDLHPALADPHLETFLSLATRSGFHPAVRRHLFRLLQTAALPPACHDTVFSAALGAVAMDDEAAAVKAAALTILRRLTDLYPGLLGEVKSVIRDRLPREGCAFHSRARREFKITPEK